MLKMAEKGVKYIKGFEIILTGEVKKRIDWLTDNYDKEISAWLGGEIKGNDIIIDDLLFPEQEVGGTSVDTDGKQLVLLRKEYGDRCKRIIGHWHSHNTMSASWSSTDEEFIKQHMHGRDLRVFLVSARREEIRTRVEIGIPVRMGLDGLNIKTESEDPELESEMNELIKKKVKEKTYTFSEKSKGKDAWGWEEYDENYDFENLYVIKKSHDVNITGLHKDIFDKIEDMFPNEKNVTLRPDGRVDIIYLVGDKKNARSFRDKLRELIDTISESIFIEQTEFLGEGEIPYDDEYYQNLEDKERTYYIN